MKPRLIRLSYFIWLIIPAAAWGIYALYGLPHMLWSYRWVGPDSAVYFDERHKTECHFIGPYGAFTVRAHQGSCGWVVRLFKKTEAR